jgi:hypothetical protein
MKIPVMRHFFLLLLISTFSLDCSSDEPIFINNTDHANFPLVFETLQVMSEHDGIVYHFQLRSTQAGDSLLLLAFISNENEDTLLIKREALQIQSSTGIRSALIPTDTGKTIIPPSQQRLLRFYFRPVTNLELYNCIGYAGDLDSTYSIETDFVFRKGSEAMQTQRIEFSLPQKIHLAYKATFAREEKLRLFHFFDQEALKETLETALRKKNADPETQQHSHIQVSKNDLLIAGTLLRLHFYTIDSVLHMRLRIVNHGEQLVLIDPQLIVVNNNDNRTQPDLISVNGTAIALRKSQHLVRGGDRIEIVATFRLNVNDMFSLSLEDAVKLSANDGNPFKQTIQFTQL